MKKAILYFIFLLLSNCILPRQPKMEELIGTYYYEFGYYAEYIEFKGDSTYFHYAIDYKKDTVAKYIGQWIFDQDSPDILLCGFMPYSKKTNKICVESKWKYGVRYESYFMSPPVLEAGFSRPFNKIR